jgi:hypothetical protein
MSQMTPEVSRLLEKALSLSIEEQEALADSLISNLGGKVDEGVQAAWEAEIGKRLAELDSAKPRPPHGPKSAAAIWQSYLDLLVWKRAPRPLLLTLILPVWVGHSCPTPLTLFLTPTGMSLLTSPSPAENRDRRCLVNWEKNSQSRGRK